MTEGWTSELCGCFQDPMNCYVTCWCPCVTFGQNVEILDKATTSCVYAGVICVVLAYFGFSSCYTCTYRGKLRGQFAIPGNQCGDFCIHFWCPACALCQEHRELQNRGLDPDKGWVSMDDQRAPPVPSSMTR